MKIKCFTQSLSICDKSNGQKFNQRDQFGTQRRFPVIAIIKLCSDTLHYPVDKINKCVFFRIFFPPEIYMERDLNLNEIPVVLRWNTQFFFILKKSLTKPMKHLGNAGE